MFSYATIQGDLGGKSIFWIVVVWVVMREIVNMSTRLNSESLSRWSSLYVHILR